VHPPSFMYCFQDHNGKDSKIIEITVNVPFRKCIITNKILLEAALLKFHNDFSA
jgi:hypothetical protein